MAKQVWIENGIIVFYGNRAGYVREGYAVADPVFHTSELEGFCLLYTSDAADEL